jgi:hypothetical protein
MPLPSTPLKDQKNAKFTAQIQDQKQSRKMGVSMDHQSSANRDQERGMKTTLISST